jgi:hypothetical protein
LQSPSLNYYHRFLFTLNVYIIDIWKDYDAYENSLNKVLAKALLSEFGPKYMNARSIYRERKNFTDGIQKQMLARPPRLIINSKDNSQVKLWQALIAFEKSVSLPHLMLSVNVFNYARIPTNSNKKHSEIESHSPLTSVLCASIIFQKSGTKLPSIM